jgi:hypothetical protein
VVAEAAASALTGVSQREDCFGSPLDKQDERYILLLFVRGKEELL